MINEYIEINKMDCFYIAYRGVLEPLELCDYFNDDDDDDQIEVINLEDYVNSIIDSGIDNFKLYQGISNIGGIGLLAVVKNGEII